MTQQDYKDLSSSIEPEKSSPADTGEIPELPTVGAPKIYVAPEGHIVLVLPAGAVVTESMAIAAAEDVERLTGTGKTLVLLVLTGIEALTRGARTVFGTTRSLDAVAVLGVSPVDRVIANFLLGGNTLPCPTRYFSAEPEALAWLERKRTLA